MKRRKLSLEETKLWEKVAKSTLPLNDKILTESDISSGQISPKNSKPTNAPPKRALRPQLNENIAIKNLNSKSIFRMIKSKTEQF